MGGETWTIGALLKVSAEYLGGRGVESPRLNAEVLLTHQLAVDRVYLYLNLEQPLSAAELDGFRSLVRRRAGREPLQYITGAQEFWSLDFSVGPAVLIPRPETELLVEEGARRLRSPPGDRTGPPRVLDLGTGSGAVAVSLAKEIPEARLLATDLSAAALAVALENARHHGVQERICFLQADLLAPLKGCGGPFDLILSNPPYVATEDYLELPPEVREHEPRQALDGGRGGMHFLERIIAGAPALLKPGGWLLLEMSPAQTERALRLIARTGAFREAERIRDYARRFRVVAALRA